MSEAIEKIIKGDCPKCGPKRNALIVGEHRTSFEDPASGVWGNTDYRILVCRGCDEPYFQREEVFSEDVDHQQNPITGEWEAYLPSLIAYWPSPSKRERPAWFDELPLIDTTLSQLMNDVYTCLNYDIRIPAAIAARTCFDRATELLGIEPSEPFAKKLILLAKQGKISSDEIISLGALTDAGNAAAHRGWRPNTNELDTMMSILEAFLHRSFVLAKAANALKLKIPAKPKRSPKPPKAKKSNAPSIAAKISS